MKEIQPGDKVSLPNHPFLSNGYVKRIYNDLDMYVIKLDNMADPRYAYNTDEVIMKINDLEVIL